MVQTYTISGMHCGACIQRVTAALQPFAERVNVSLEPPQAILTNPGANDIAQLNAAVAKAGAYKLSLVSSAPIQSVSEVAPDGEQGWLTSYWPLLLITAYVSLASFAGADGWQSWMTNFMAGFFLVFSAFKFLDLKGFANAYASYDLLAKRWHAWGFIYPFLEFALGLAYLFRFAPSWTHTATILLMGFSSLGVIDALRQQRRIQCACLGTVLNLPMSTITLVEDLGMAAMAAMALLAGGAHLGH